MVPASVPMVEQSGPLLYAAEYDSVVDVFTFPQGKRIQRLLNVDGAYGLCAGIHDDVWITGQSGYANIAEFARGATTPTVVLNAPGVYGTGCSVDPGTGNVALVEAGTISDPANIAVFPDAPKYPPVIYQPVQHSQYLYCTYDGSGNLFVAGDIHDTTPFLVELKKGSKKFLTIALDRTIASVGGLQWDGAHLALADGSATSIYELAVSGTHAKTIGTTILNGSDDLGYQFTIYNGQVVGRLPRDGRKGIEYWNYPAGGDPVGAFGKGEWFYGAFAVIK